MATASASPLTTESPPVVVPWDDVLTDVQGQEDPEAPPACQVAGCDHTAFRSCEYCGKQVCLFHHRTYVGFCQIDRDYCVTCYAARTRREATMLAEASEAYQRYHLDRLERRQEPSRSPNTISTI